MIRIWLDSEGFPGGSVGKDSACNAGDPGLTPESGRSPGGGNSGPLQYSCLENPMDRGVWWAMVHLVAKSQTQLSHFHFHTHTHTHIYLMPSDQGWGKYSKDTLSVPLYLLYCCKNNFYITWRIKTVFKNIFNKEKTKCIFNLS